MTPLGEFLRHGTGPPAPPPGDHEDVPDRPARIIDTCDALDHGLALLPDPPRTW